MELKKSFIIAVLSAALLMTGCAGSDSSSQTESKSDTTESVTDSTTDSKASSEAEPVKERPTNIIDGVDYLVLASYGNKLPDDWADKITIETLTCSQDYDVYVEKRAAEAYRQLKAALEKEDVHIDIDTGYRSVAEQEEITQRYRERYGHEYVKQYIAVPGYSEHQTGLAIDCASWSGTFSETQEAVWLAEHAHEYGFIIRYPEGKEDITGFQHEAWHIRYVGTDIAEKIYKSGLCLEEYLGLS